MKSLYVRTMFPEGCLELLRVDMADIGHGTNCKLSFVIISSFFHFSLFSPFFHYKQGGHSDHGTNLQ